MLGISKQIARDNLYETFRRLGLTPVSVFQVVSLKSPLKLITFDFHKLIGNKHDDK